MDAYTTVIFSSILSVVGTLVVFYLSMLVKTIKSLSESVANVTKTLAVFEQRLKGVESQVSEVKRWTSNQEKTIKDLIKG